MFCFNYQVPFLFSNILCVLNYLPGFVPVQWHPLCFVLPTWFCSCSVASSVFCITYLVLFLFSGILCVLYYLPGSVPVQWYPLCFVLLTWFCSCSVASSVFCSPSSAGASSSFSSSFRVGRPVASCAFLASSSSFSRK